MNVSNNKLEAASIAFKQHFSSLFLNGYTEMTHSVINTVEGWVSTLPSDYNWHLQYWSRNLDLKLHERCRRGMHSWHEYSNIHKKTLDKKIENSIKIDICTELPTGYEIFSVSRKFGSLFPLFINMPKLKAIVSDYVYKRKKYWRDDMLLPLRKNIILSEDEKNIYSLAKDSPHCFNDVKLTAIEMDTIRALLMLKSVKEIAYLHRCSITAEKKRINAIKRKLNCEKEPLSSLFSSLEKKGIIEACINLHSRYEI